MKKTLLCLLLACLTLGGCQPARPKSEVPYKLGPVQGPSVDQEIAFYRQRTQQNPRSFLEKAALAGAYLAKAQFSGDTSFYVLAEKTAQESLKLQGDHNFAAVMILASVNEARHEFAKSLELAKSVYDFDPSNLDAQSMMSSNLVELGRLEEALKFSESTYKAMPTSGSLMQLARCKIATGQDDEARKLLLRALQLEQAGERKVSARLRSLLGEMELRQGRPAEAERCFTAALQAQKSHAPALLGLARKEQRAGNLEAASQWLTQAFSYTQNPAILTEVAHLKALSGDKTGAEELRAKAEALLRPEIAQGTFGHARDLARILLDRGDAHSVKEAVQILERESQQRGDARLHELLGEAYGAAGEMEKAEQSLSRALATGLKEPALWARMARLAEKQGHPEKARECLERARSLDPTFQPAWLDR